MMKILLTLLGAGLLATATASAGGDLNPVQWSVVRDEIGRSVCVLSLKNRDGSESRVEEFRSRANCGSPAAETPVARAVEKAIESASLPLMPVTPEDVGAHYPPDATVEQASASWRRACLNSEVFLRPILVELPPALASEDLRCSECPDVVPVLRKVSWRQLAPYVGAHFWPDPVKTPPGAAGEPIGQPEYTFHVCSGINGISEMKAPDRQLTRAAFVAAMGAEDLRTIASSHFSRILESGEFLALDSDAARTAHLRRKLPAAVAEDPDVEASACATLARFAASLGIVVEDCAAGSAPAPRR